jgi:hypothetical protein
MLNRERMVFTAAKLDIVIAWSLKVVKGSILYSSGYTSRQLDGYTGFIASRCSQVGEGGSFDSTLTLYRAGMKRLNLLWV